MKNFEIEAEINDADFSTILEALSFWEVQIGAELEVINRIKHLPEPEFPDEETKIAFHTWKNSMIGKEKELRKSIKIRMEKSILLKAKLLLMNQRNACNQFFNSVESNEQQEE